MQCVFLPKCLLHQSHHHRTAVSAPCSRPQTRQCCPADRRVTAGLRVNHLSSQQQAAWKHSAALEPNLTSVGKSPLLQKQQNPGVPARQPVWQEHSQQCLLHSAAAKVSGALQQSQECSSHSEDLGESFSHTDQTLQLYFL